MNNAVRQDIDNAARRYGAHRTDAELAAKAADDLRRERDNMRRKYWPEYDARIAALEAVK